MDSVAGRLLVELYFEIILWLIIKCLDLFVFCLTFYFTVDLYLGYMNIYLSFEI